jgi:hypothetical protein
VPVQGGGADRSVLEGPWSLETRVRGLGAVAIPFSRPVLSSVRPVKM